MEEAEEKKVWDDYEDERWPGCANVREEMELVKAEPEGGQDSARMDPEGEVGKEKQENNARDRSGGKRDHRQPWEEAVGIGWWKDGFFSPSGES